MDEALGKDVLISIGVALKGPVASVRLDGQITPTSLASNVKSPLHHQMSRIPHPPLKHSAPPYFVLLDRKKLGLELGSRKCRVWRRTGVC